MTIRRSGDAARPPAADPLRDADALLEAQLLDAWCEVVARSLALPPDVRQALEVRSAAVGVVVFPGVTDFAWSELEQAYGTNNQCHLHRDGRPHYAWNVRRANALY